MFLENPTIQDFIKFIEESKLEKDHSILLFIGENCKIDLNDIVQTCNRFNVQLVGGVFPKIINNKNLVSDGMIIKIARYSVHPIYFSESEDFEAQIQDYKSIEFSTAFLLTDALNPKVKEHLDSLYTYLGNNINFIGGGVGYTQNQNKGSLLTNDGVYHTGSIVTLSNVDPLINSQHGWEKLTGPFLVTKSSKNIIKEINWENAFKVYQENIKQTTNIDIIPEEFSKTSMNFPFGIFKEERGYIVRDPYHLTDDNCLQCVGNVPENTLIDILSIDKKQIKEIPKKIISKYKPIQEDLIDVILFDCISRANYLQDQFQIELDGLCNEIKSINKDIDIEGALSIGEIYSGGNGYLELLNKSIVTSLLYK
jgi:hypothetical protein